MSLVKKVVAVAAMTCLSSLFAADVSSATSHSKTAQAKPMEEKLPWYFTVSSGYAWTMKPGITNPDTSFWDASNQGYDQDLTDGSFIGLGFGKELISWLDVDVEWTQYRQFVYNKHQTGTSSTPAFTGSHRTRFFDLDNDGFLASFRLHLPRDWNWDMGCISVSPFAGAGLGFGVNQMTNFHTVGHNSTTSVGSTSSIGEPVTKVAFAWQANVGLSFRPTNSAASMNFAYRYYDGGTFNGPSRIIDNTANGTWVTCKAWEGRVKTNQFLVYLKYDM
ncbi:MAG: hypothetical protein P0S95_00920 [Rhabdochlamydiaceae bacterium]|nr:hypothetical protein [Candidatus Amphrikana amoebophyrae]